MTRFSVVFDACVLYPVPLRDLLMHLEMTHLFRARWTERIHDEWTRSVLAQRSDLSTAQLQRTRELMNAAVPDARVQGYEYLIDGSRTDMGSQGFSLSRIGGRGWRAAPGEGGRRRSRLCVRSVSASGRQTTCPHPGLFPAGAERVTDRYGEPGFFPLPHQRERVARSAG